jgi:hypothetical protein
LIFSERPMVERLLAERPTSTVADLPLPERSQLLRSLQSRCLLYIEANEIAYATFGLP